MTLKLTMKVVTPPSTLTTPEMNPVMEVEEVTMTMKMTMLMMTAKDQTERSNDLFSFQFIAMWIMNEQAIYIIVCMALTTLEL